jgi:hypothetical protein
VLSTIEEYCSTLACPSLAEAREEIRSTDTPFLRAIIQRPCVSANGSARISVTGHFLAWSRTFIYDAETQALVGVQYIDDVASCQRVAPTEPGFGSFTGFYGEVAPDCGPGELGIVIPDACADAGALDDYGWAIDAGPPYECVLGP